MVSLRCRERSRVDKESESYPCNKYNSLLCKNDREKINMLKKRKKGG
jgi:hypothetical protein